jgi:hypothetical protein
MARLYSISFSDKGLQGIIVSAIKTCRLDAASENAIRHCHHDRHVAPVKDPDCKQMGRFRSRESETETDPSFGFFQQ